ncbi:MAG: carboxypeptidase regulatory-like domain-containing protein, partial [Myxococcota bacterium]
MMRNLGLLAMASLLAVNAVSCGGSSDQTAQTEPLSPGVFGQVVDTTGVPIEGALVSAGVAMATTDNQGRYAIDSLSPGAIMLRAEADGYLSYSASRLLGASPSALRIVLLREASPLPLDAGAGGVVTGIRGARVELPPGALVDPQGASVSGQVEVFLTPIDASDPEEQQAAPGALQAVDGQEQPQKLESFGMMDIAIRQEGRSLELAPGQSMDIQIPAVAQMEEEPPETMPLWSFDEDTAVWRQEGDMTWDAASDTWSANITRMASWNADRVQETTCIRGLVIDEDTGEPLPGAAVLGFGVDYQSSDATWTDAQGRFVLLVRTSSTTRVEALHDPNGGQTRDIDSGDQIAQQPANLDDTACTDVGEWRIKRGEVLTPPSGNNNGGMAAICDLPALDAIRTCLPTMTALFTCHNPVGSCELVGGGLGGYRYDNGARAETDFDLGLGQLTTTYYGPDETLCGSQTIDTSTLEIRVELADGTVGTFSGSTGGAGEAITYTCEGGESFVLDARTQAILAACSGDSESCDPGEGTSNGGVSLGQMCAQPSDCG